MKRCESGGVVSAVRDFATPRSLDSETRYGPAGGLIEVRVGAGLHLKFAGSASRLSLLTTK